MSSLPLETTFGALQAVPTIIALASGTTNGITRVICIAGAVVSLTLALAPLIDAIGDLLNGNLVKFLAVGAAILGVMTAVRVPNRIIGTLAATGGCLLALHALGIIG